MRIHLSSIGCASFYEPILRRRTRWSVATQRGRLSALPLVGGGTGDGEVWFTTTTPWLVNYEVTCTESAISAYIDTVTANESPLGYDELHGSTASDPSIQEVGRGTTKAKTAIGRMKVRVSTASDCSWQVSVVSAS